MVLQCDPLSAFSERLYFTSFPHPAPNPALLNKRCNDPDNRPKIRTRSRSGMASSAGDETASYYYFTIDDQLLYLSFFQDWGPLNMAQVYRACILIHELLEDADLSEHRIVLYSSDDPRRKANAALLMALYVLIVQRRLPWDAFQPIAEVEFMPFRDAGRGPSDFNLNIQDCIWGIWKAMQNGLCDMNDFDVEDYEFYEKVENGDWNWITPNFIAFASPVDTAWIKTQKEKEKEPVPGTTLYSAAPPTKSLALQRKLPTPFLNCLEYFEKRNVKLVIRLNTQLYDREVFLDRGIDHLELYFDDGTNPTDEITRLFIETVDKIVEAGGAIAVHCKAGLGRTGTLIGAYLIWKYGFTANEVIAFMRIVRPGSVVGPQQQYMYLKQLEWSKWAAADEIQRLQAQMAEPAPLVTPATPPAETDEEFNNKMDTTPPPSTSMTHPPVTPSRHIAAATAHAKAIATPGQPRKTPRTKRVAREALEDSDLEDEANDVLPPMVDEPSNRPKITAKGGTTSTNGRSIPPASAPRPTRVTRSGIAGSSRANPPPPSPAKSTGRQQPPNKIPRLATTKTTTAAKAAVRQKPVPVPPVNRKNAASPIPSRLPTLIPKRPGATLTDVVAEGSRKASQSDAWMKDHAAAVVVPANKDARPGLRKAKKRRSSFSAADVVA
ncbi:phosphatases II [Cylindrobasidium torrendii FP15055 ss-10]|uniref:protein-tyrosine-phosphatase n=1 Tax=Cylindrobasidium torrendii FP15055 ss-10 TaxID=1314674 RepID=A0A0D7BMQ1_9AGAR|nr:phosphatases II [Cylindrobasidium torrendii FP15055 ss-10]